VQDSETGLNNLQQISSSPVSATQQSNVVHFEDEDEETDELELISHTPLLHFSLIEQQAVPPPGTGQSDKSQPQ